MICNVLDSTFLASSGGGHCLPTAVVVQGRQPDQIGQNSASGCGPVDQKIVSFKSELAMHDVSFCFIYLFIFLWLSAFLSLKLVLSAYFHLMLLFA